MPTYSYKCSKCGYKFDSYLPIANRNNTQKCEMCLGPADRDIGSELTISNPRVYEDHPRWSWSMGVATPAEGREILKSHPDIEFKFGDYGPIKVNNRQHKLRIADIRGMEEYN